MPNTPKAEKKSGSPPLGDLEVQVLEFVWSNTGSTAKDAHTQFGSSRGISLNTVQSAMERLYRKGLLARTKSGHAYHYSAVVARETLLATLINDVLGRFKTNAASSAAAIIDAAQQLDADALTLLEEEIKRRRQSEEP